MAPRRILVVIAVAAVAAVVLPLGRPASAVVIPPQLRVVDLGAHQIAVAADAAGAAETVATPHLSRVEASEPFEMVGVTAREGVAVPAHGAVRTSRDGVTWSPWYDLHFDGDHGPDPGSGEMRRSVAGSGAVYTGTARFAEVRTDRAQEGLALNLVDVDGDTASLATKAKAFLDALVHPQQPAAHGAGALPPVISRAGWGADESWRRGDPSYGDVQMGIVHHTEGSNSYTAEGAAAVVRGVYEYHVFGRGWDDIGYNFLVDKYGRIYEGRFGGIDRSPIGAQAGGFNTYSTGVSIMGSFTGVAPTGPSFDSVARILAWKFGVHRVDPLGQTVVVSGGSTKYPAGVPVLLRNVSGHRDVSLTDCPGNFLYVQLGTLARWITNYSRGWTGETIALGGASALADDANGATANYAGQLHVFSSAGGELRHAFLTPAGWVTERLDAGRSTGRDVSAFGYMGQLHVLNTGSDNGDVLRHTWWDPVAQRWLAETLDRTGSTGRAGSATAWGNQVQIVNRGRSGTLRSVWWDPVANAWGQRDLGPSAATATAVAAFGAQFHVFTGRAPATGLRHDWWDPYAGAWFSETLDVSTVWSRVDSMLFDGGIHMFGSSPGGLRHLWWRLGWAVETLWAGVPATGPVSVEPYLGGVHVFFGSTDAGRGVLRHYFFQGGWGAEILEPDWSTGVATTTMLEGPWVHVYTGSRTGPGDIRHHWYSP